MPKDLGKHNIRMAYPPLIKAHWHAHQLHRPIRQQRNARNVKDLLFGIGIQGEQRIRMLGEMVSAMVFPQRG